MNTAAIVCLLLFPVCVTSEPAFQAPPLSKAEAIQLAGAAIVRNGCTDLLPLRSRPKLSENQPRIDFEFRIKHELDCHAVRAGEGQVNGKPRWIIAFSVRHSCPECTTFRERLVLMDKDGSNLRLENRTNRIKRILRNLR